MYSSRGERLPPLCQSATKLNPPPLLITQISVTTSTSPSHSDCFTKDVTHQALCVSEGVSGGNSDGTLNCNNGLDLLSLDDRRFYDSCLNHTRCVMLQIQQHYNYGTLPPSLPSLPPFLPPPAPPPLSLSLSLSLFYK